MKSKPEAPETPEDSEIPEEPVAESKWQKGAESHWVNPMFKNSPALSNNDLSNAGDPIEGDLTTSNFNSNYNTIMKELSTAMVERKELVFAQRQGSSFMRSRGRCLSGSPPGRRG